MDIIETISIDDVLKMDFEPENKYDDKAIKNPRRSKILSKRVTKMGNYAQHATGIIPPLKVHQLRHPHQQ